MLSDREIVEMLVSAPLQTEDDVLALLREHRVSGADRERILELAVARVESDRASATTT